MAWLDFLQGRPLPALHSGCVVRIDSTGKNWAVEKALLERGGRIMGDAAIEVMDVEDPGRILSSVQYHRGLCDALQEVEHHFQNARWMQHPADIVEMCDKEVCHARLQAAGVRVPPSLGVVSGFDDLMARMDLAGRNRVFVKLCHGSSASGSVALERSGSRIQAFSTAKRSESPQGTVLHNWRSVSRYEELRDIRKLVDAVCRHRAHVELWLPKAGWHGRRFDVRIVVIGGKSRHVVARLAEGPFTNLQTGAVRAPADELLAHLGKARFAELCSEAERAMCCYPRSLYGGVDVMIDAQRGLPHVLEVNAFGDLLPGVHFKGLDTYTWEIDQVSSTGT